MEFYYKENDWAQLSNGALQGTIQTQNVNVPYAVLVNEPEVTDHVSKLAPALRDSLDRLWKLYQGKR
jgi:hypothetical protein